MPIIIDGWNLIRNSSSEIDDADMESLDSADCLIARLARFQETRADPIILVFDSRREYLGLSYRNNPKLTVVPSRDADRYIKRYIDAVPERQRRNLRVVSSDNEIYFYAKSSYATPVRSEEFWGKLKRSRNGRGADVQG
jgi:predicted RNA-binding protein with PIN domain